MSELRPAMQYTTLTQQSATLELGMWTFIVTEILFFGALLFSYTVYRLGYPEQFALAGHDSKILLGSINEALLVTSSVTMVCALDRVRRDDNRGGTALLAATAVLGLAFLGVKGFEYYQDFDDHTVPVFDYVLKAGYKPPTELFWIFYFVGTLIHAIHMGVGIILVSIMALKTWRGAFSREYYAPVAVVGLYWSFVDTVWLFLFAAIYPLGRGG